MIRILLSFLLFSLFINSYAFIFTEDKDGSLLPIDICKIYGNGNYCSFTSLAKYRNKYYCAFREGMSHVGDGDYGVIKILTSDDGNCWKLDEVIKGSLIDFRDPYLSVTPDGRLLILCGARIKNEAGIYITKSYYATKKGKRFSTFKPIKLPPEVDDVYCAWCWRVTWYKKIGYTIEYRYDGNKQRVELLKTADGENYDRITTLNVPGNPSEGKIVMVGKNEMIAVIRTNENGYMGRSFFPYTEWEWKELPFFVGGHDLAFLKKTFIVASRRHESNGNSETCIYYGSANDWFSRYISLPSGGDTGYCGILEVGDEIWFSYYSSHENVKPSIYLSKIPYSFFEK